MVLGDGAITLRVDGVGRRRGGGDGAHERAPRRPARCARAVRAGPPHHAHRPRPRAARRWSSPPGSSSWPSRSCGRRLDIELVRSAAGDEPTDDRGQDRDRSRGAQPQLHPGRGRRGHGGPRRSRHRAPAGGRAPRAEARHPGLRRGRGAGHHRHPDARVDDHLDGTDAGRGERRGQRRVRRDRRAHAVGRDGHRPRPGRAWCGRWRGSPSGPRWRATTSSGVDGWAGCSGRSPTRVPRRSPRPSPTPRGRRPTTSSATTIVAATRSGLTARAMSRFRPRARLVGVSPVERTVRQLTLSWGVVPLLVDQCDTLDDLVWYSRQRGGRRRARRAGRARGDAGRLAHRGATARPTCCGSCGSGEPWPPRRGDRPARCGAGRAGPRHDGPLDGLRPGGSAARRPLPRRCATTGGATPGLGGCPVRTGARPTSTTC